MSQSDKKTLGIILGLILLIVFTVGISYAFFTYTQNGTTDNVIKTGDIRFSYTENSNVGNGISILDALPIADDKGKLLTGNGNVFEFTITGRTTGSSNINYELTAEKLPSSQIPDNIVKIYLTELRGSTEVPVENNAVKTYDQYRQTDRTTKNEKTIYTGQVGANIPNYEKIFRLRMWIDENADYSADEGSSTGEGKYNEMSFSIRVNAYANDSRINTDPPIPEKAYKTGDFVTLKDGSNWYVVVDSGIESDKVTLLSSTILPDLSYDSDGTTVYDAGDSTNIAYYIKNTYLPSITTSLISSGGNVTGLLSRILTKDEVIHLQGLLATSIDAATWLYAGNYWTVTPDGIGMLTVVKDSNLGTAAATEVLGVRPVIEINKENIL